MPDDAPKALGRYMLHGSISSGGMATVHYGRLVGPVGFSRTVAIKRLHPHLAGDPEFVALLLDEARLAGRIRHPNVVQTIDVVTDSSELFIVMEYVQGESLARLTRAARDAGEKTPPSIATAIMAGVLHGLHAAHEARGDGGEPLEIVHRDVSPQNVVVGADGLARVIDFGVAKAASRLQTTRDGQVKGKLAYMAPEQIRGGKVSRRSDVYSATVVLWEVLTGRRLFSGDNDGMVLEQVLLGVVEPPSTVVPTLPDGLDAIVARGTERDPAKRFATARDMALALEQAVRPALGSEVAEWLERMVGPVLAERAARVAEIEGLGGSRVDAKHAVSEIRSGGAVAESMPSQLSSISVATQSSDAGRSKSRWGALVVLGAIAVLGGVFVASRRSAGQSTSPVAPPPSVLVSPSVSAGAPAGVAPASAEPSAAPAPASAPAAAPSPRTPSRPTARPNCNPPYVRDDQGRIIWKRQCI